MLRANLHDMKRLKPSVMLCSGEGIEYDSPRTLWQYRFPVIFSKFYPIKSPFSRGLSLEILSQI